MDKDTENGSENQENQSWFWSNTRQKGEKEAENDISFTRTSGPMNAENAIKWLKDELEDEK